ncbi:MAG: LacI family DNA-binding transcriptional regulator [Lentisphaeria bacterium]|nr:LacI family DNA-binding transcriptional regulator [Lentisphaeria bacterium]
MVTLKDVAQAANVSKSTVSAVLANRASELGIKEETCRKVRHVAARLRYRKNEIAAQMKSNRANMIAFFMRHSYMQEFSFQATGGASLEAEKQGCYLKTVISGEESNIGWQLDYTIGQCPAALIHFGDPGGERQRFVEAAQECRLPLVFIDYREAPPAKSILSDDEAGIREVIRLLHTLGHRHIIHLTDPVRAQYAATRYRAFLEAMKEFGLPVTDGNIFLEQRDGSYGEISERLIRLFRSPSPPTAICCGTDYFALQALTVLQSIGVRVPEEVSVAGFGDLNFARKCAPRLTTVGQQFEELGTRAVRLALSGDEAAPDTILLPTNLIVRESTAPAIR